MAYLKYLILCVALLSGPVLAGYAQLSPPPGWSQGMGAAVPGTAGKFAYGSAANGAVFRGTTVLTNASLNVGGKLVTVPVGMRLAANAGLYAARYSFTNPWLFAAVTAAPIAYAWFKESGLEVKDGIWQKKEIEGHCFNGTCYEYSYDGSTWGSPGTACGQGYAVYTAGNSESARYIPGSFIEPDTCGMKFQYLDYAQETRDFSIQRRPLPPSESETWRPVQLPEFETTIEPFPIPAGVPQEMPFPLPVDAPVINPSPDFPPLDEPAPAPDFSKEIADYVDPSALSRPMNVPMGEPVPVPNTNPQKYSRPVTTLKPAQNPTSPWQVDVQPITIDSTDPDVPVEPDPDSGSTTTPKTPGLCESYPDILACQKFDTPESDELETKDKTISITPDSGWGSDGGSCPAPRHFSKGEFSFQIYCDFASGIKPVIIAVAWLVAAGILIGFKFGES